MYSDAIYLLELLVKARHNPNMTLWGYSNPVIIQAVIVHKLVDVLITLGKRNGDVGSVLREAAGSFGRNFADDLYGLLDSEWN